jgi:hypothetical protein
VAGSRNFQSVHARTPNVIAAPAIDRIVMTQTRGIVSWRFVSPAEASPLVARTVVPAVNRLSPRNHGRKRTSGIEGWAYILPAFVLNSRFPAWSEERPRR